MVHGGLHGGNLASAVLLWYYAGVTLDRRKNVLVFSHTYFFPILPPTGATYSYPAGIACFVLATTINKCYYTFLLAVVPLLLRINMMLFATFITDTINGTFTSSATAYTA